MAEPGILGAYEPIDISHVAAKQPPIYGFGFETVGAGWKGGSAQTDYGLHQAAYEGEIFSSIRDEAKKRGIDTPPYLGPNIAMYERRVKAAGNTNVLNVFERAHYDAVRQFWGRIGEERKKDPAFLKDLPVFDTDSMQAEARRRRQVDETASNEIYAKSTNAGKFAWWIGNFSTAVKDPLSYLPLGAATKGATTTAGAVVKGFGQGATINAGVTVALEPFTQADATARRQDRGIGDIAADVALSALFGGVLEGATAGIGFKLGHGGLDVDIDPNLPPDQRAAFNVLTRDAEIRAANPFVRTPAGDAEHGNRLSATIAALEMGQPVPKFTKGRLQAGTSLGGGAERFRAMVDAAEGRTRNLRSSADGFFQFTDRTWLTYYKREIGAKGLTDTEILKKKTNQPTATRLFEALTKDNQSMLWAAGLPDSETNLYLAHFLGPKSMRVLRAAPETPVETILPPSFITANPEVLRGKTAGEVIAWADRKMGGEGVVAEMPDAPTLREDIFADEGEYRGALDELELTERVPDEGPDFALREPDAAAPPGRFDYETARSFMETETVFPPRDTRGGGVFYHGARGEVPDLQEGYYNADNIYGGFETFYATEALDVSAGYGRKRDTARIYKVGENEPVSFFDMEERRPVAEIEDLFGVGADDFGLVPMAIEEAERNGTVSLRDVMDEIRGFSREEGVSKDGVQEIFDTAIYNLREKGFGGMRHIGGLNTGGQPHAVKIYFNAPEQIKLSDITPRRAYEPAQASTPEQVVAEIKAEGPHFDDPNGPDAVNQVDNTLHDLTAEDLGPDLAQFRISEEGRTITVADALAEIETDEAAIKALKDCL